MKIQSISINTYRILDRQKIDFPMDSIFPRGAQIIGVIGPNGSGKTTFCSAIAHMFHSFSIGRYFDCDYEVRFEQNGVARTVKHVRGKVSFSEAGENNFSYLAKKKKHQNEHEEIANYMEHFWPGRLILSTFETRGEYPNPKTWNSLGADNLSKQDISDIYGKNLYSFPSLSNGILRFWMTEEKNRIAKEAFKRMSLDVIEEVEVKIVRRVVEASDELENHGEYHSEERAFIEYLRRTRLLKITTDSQQISVAALKRIYEEMPSSVTNLFYVNSLFFIKNGVKLGFEELSSGEKFFIVRYLAILSAIEDDSLVVIEEPENHLNPSWRELFIPLIHRMATAYNSSVIFTTHDYRSIRGLHNENVFQLFDGKVKQVQSPTLLCDEFDFENLGERVQLLAIQDIKQALENSSVNIRTKIINSMARVPEKKELRLRYLGGDI